MAVNPYHGPGGTRTYGIGQFCSADDIYAVMYEGDETQLISMLNVVAQQGETAAAEQGYMEAVVSVLRDVASAELKVAVCKAVRSAGQCGHEHQGEIAGLLGDESTEVKFQACLTLSSMGVNAQGVRADIAMLLKDSEANVRCVACAALGSIGATSEVSALVEMFQDESPEVQGAACIALGTLGDSRTAADVAKFIDNPRSRAQALTALGEMGTASLGDEQLEAICKCLQDEDQETRAIAAMVIGKKAKYVAASAKVFRRVTDLLKHKDGRFRSSAAVALGCMGERGASEAAALVLLLEDDFEESVANALVVGGVRARAAAPLRKPKCAAAVALGSMPLTGARYANDLARLLLDDDWETRLCACDALGMLGQAATSLSDNVGKLLGDEMYSVRAKAASTLGKLGDATCAQALADVLADNSAAVREEALLAIASMGFEAQEHAGKVFEQLSAHSPNVRCAAVKCLGQMGEKGQFYAGPVAQRLVQEEETRVKIAALEALGLMGDRGAAYVEDVAACIQDAMPQVRAQAALTLGKMGIEGAAFLEDVRYLCNDPHETVRKSAHVAHSAMAGDFFVTAGDGE